MLIYVFAHIEWHIKAHKKDFFFFVKFTSLGIHNFGFRAEHTSSKFYVTVALGTVCKQIIMKSVIKIWF